MSESDRGRLTLSCVRKTKCGTVKLHPVSVDTTLSSARSRLMDERRLQGWMWLSGVVGSEAAEVVHDYGVALPTRGLKFHVTTLNDSTK